MLSFRRPHFVHQELILFLHRKYISSVFFRMKSNSNRLQSVSFLLERMSNIYLNFNVAIKEKQ